MKKKIILILSVLIALSSILFDNLENISTAQECNDCTPISTEPGEADHCPITPILKLDPTNPTTISVGQSITINMIDGMGPFTWGDPGNGYTWAYGIIPDPSKPKIKVTDGRSNTLQCASGT